MKNIVLSKNPNRVRGEILDLRGEKYGELTVLDFDSKDSHGRARWKCLCSCGKEKVVLSNHLRTGETISCGHVAKHKSSKRISKMSTTHGASKEPWYPSYVSMVKRVTNKKYEYYDYYDKTINGDKIEKDWLNNPWSFYKEIGTYPGKGYSIDRINPKLGYIVGNVRWATKEQQASNRLPSHTSNTTYQGVSLLKKGTGRRSQDMYKATITINHKKMNLGTFYSIKEAIKTRYLADTLYHRNIDDRVTKLAFKYGWNEMTTEDKLAYLKQAKDNTRKHLASASKSVIAISPDGKSYKFNSIEDIKRHFHIKSNIRRAIKNGKPLSGNSSMPGWLFKFDD